MTKASISLTMNGRPTALCVSSRTTLADAIRDDARLTGTHIGCEHGVCGACTVIVDGLAVRSCLLLAVQADGSDVVTIEGLSIDGAMSPLQQAFRRHHAVQCGFCTPGILTTMHALLQEEPEASEERIREVLSGNVCRCTGYVQIIAAVRDAQSSYRTEKP